MALIKCPECKKKISDKSVVCIHCGYPVDSRDKTQAFNDGLVEGEASTSKNIKGKQHFGRYVDVSIVAILTVVLILIVAKLFPYACKHEWKEATCTTPKICSKCKKVDGEANGHDWSEATCVLPKTCEKCNETEGEAVGHTWENATCQMPKTCVICSQTEGTALNEHSYKDNVCIYCDMLDPKEAEYREASSAYNDMVYAHEKCIELMESICSAWHFSIFEADNYYNFEDCLSAFCDSAKIGKGVARKALNTVLQDMGETNPDDATKCAALQVFSIAVNVVVLTHSNMNEFVELDSYLSCAKESLKLLTNTYADYTNYYVLKLYYSELSAYIEFCKAPTGSYNALLTTIETYETNLRNYRSELSFTFD